MQQFLKKVHFWLCDIEVAILDATVSEKVHFYGPDFILTELVG